VEPVPRPAADVYVMNVDGSRQTRLTIDPDNWNGQPAWSPDGRSLLMTAGPVHKPGDIYRLNADGTGATRLTQGDGPEYIAAWSLDGTRIAFVASVVGDRDGALSDLYLMSADGSNLQRLTDGPGSEWRPTWSPDGRRIAFSSNRDGNWRLYVIDASGGAATPITAGRGELAPAWSPDGRTIAFHRFEDDSSYIYLVAPDGTNERRLEGTGKDFEPAWSPRGDRIAFSSWRDGLGQIYVMDADGQNVQNLSRNPGMRHGLPAWSPDGTRIAYTASAEAEGEGYLLDQRLGVASVVVQTMLLVGPVLLVVGRWRLPFGAMTLLLLLTGATSAVLLDTYELVPGIVAAGVVADLLLTRLQPEASSRDLHLFAVALPVLYYAGYFSDLALTEGVAWSVHLWSGAIALAAITGLLLSMVVTLSRPLPPPAAGPSP